MARGAPTVTKGTQLATTQQRYWFMRKIRDACVAYQSNGEAAWVEDVIDSSQTAYHVELHSVGDRSLGSGSNKGDIDLWVRLYHTSSQVYCYLHSDYCPADNTYNRQTSARSVAIDNVTEFDYWIMVNEYECVAIAQQGGSTFIIHFGHPITGIEDTKIGGIARVATQTSGTGTVVVDLDRDISSNITVGQRIWLCNQTPDGAGTVESTKIEIVDVDAVTASTITLSGVTNDAYSVGSLVGLYNCMNFAIASVNTGRGQYVWTARDDSGGPFSYAYLEPPQSLVEAGTDPDPSAVYPMLRPPFVFSASRGLAGYSEFMFMCGYGTQATGDRMIVGGDTDPSKAYWFFPQLVNSTQYMCIGPGATS